MQPAKLDRALEHLLGQELSDWERLELAERLALLPEAVLAEVMRQLPVIWPVSYALFYAFAEQAAKAGDCLEPQQFPDWVHAILDVYEASGLRQAQLFMEDVATTFVCHIRGEAGVRLQDIEPLLLTYARGVLGREVEIAVDPVVSYDTSTLSLPSELNLFHQEQHNFLLYKFTVTFQLAYERAGTFQHLEPLAEERDVPVSLQHFFEQFSQPQLAEHIFSIVEAIRVLRLLRREFPGLLRDCAGPFQELRPMASLIGKTQQTNFVAQLSDWLLSELCCGAGKARPNSAEFDPVPELLQEHGQRAETVAASCRLTERLYRKCRTLEGPYIPGERLIFIGELRPQAAYEAIAGRRRELTEKFVEALGAVLPLQASGKARQDPEQGHTGAGEDARQLQDGIMALFQPAGEEREREAGRRQEGVITIDGQEVKLSEELLALAQEIIREYGQLPEEFLVSAAGRAGQGLGISADVGGEEMDGHALSCPLAYDEWDFRRAGFRKNWCRVVVKDVAPIRGTFVQATLAKHKGLLSNLRRQFEMMSSRDRFVKRQRDGDEIDLDAVLEAVADNRAGQASSGRLFVRLQRTERDIAALFLVDMSSSTEGWVSTALKEALILMCESLDHLGDRYAVYGFSGMRRTRSEIFRIKEFSEGYSETVKAKIAAISPKEYTRMGPAIRHASRIMADTDARIRLLITLSDGKPEDYDGYKGAYAIEDTRHALIEAKGLGIHPFCITVDKAAHDYMAHMYGEVNYICIDDVSKLPLRMPEIYRNLTT